MINSIAPDLKACEQLMRGGSKSFFAASLLLPKRVRAPATALYAFCRLADDAIDLSSDQPTAIRALHARLSAIYDSAPHDYAADRALATVVHTYKIPQQLLEALLEGFAWDAQGRQYETMDDLYAYGARVAGTVGAMMALIMGVRSSEGLARACEMGVAMQLTNIARDVGEDARAARLYLPRALMRAEGLDPERWLASPRSSRALSRVVQTVLDKADALYQRADEGVEHLPRACRPAIRAARLIYAEIGREVERLAEGPVSQRATVSTRRKVALMLRAATAALAVAAKGPRHAPLPAIQFLVDAAIQRPRSGPDNRNFYDRTVWVLELFERLAQQDRSTHTSADRV